MAGFKTRPSDVGIRSIPEPTHFVASRSNQTDLVLDGLLGFLFGSALTDQTFQCASRYVVDENVAIEAIASIGTTRLEIVCDSKQLSTKPQQGRSAPPTLARGAVERECVSKIDRFSDGQERGGMSLRSNVSLYLNRSCPTGRSSASVEAFSLDLEAVIPILGIGVTLKAHAALRVVEVGQPSP